MKKALAVILTLGLLSAFAQAQLPQFSPGSYWTPAQALPEPLARAHHQIELGDLCQSLKTIKRWLKANPEDHPYIDHALYLKVMAQFQRRKYHQAAEVANELCAGHATSRFFEPSLHVQVEIARLFLAGEKRKVLGFIPATAYGDARAILDRVIDRWPGSELAARALSMQAEHYFNKKRYLEAQDTCQLIVDQYPNSAYYYHALLLAPQATHSQYRGPLYDSSCLTDAAIRYSRFAAEFPEKAQDLDIASRIKEVRYQQAEKAFTIADFYRRTHRTDAALYYWRDITQRFGETEFAPQARELIRQYEDQAQDHPGHV